jgi:hypothetical protein
MFSFDGRMEAKLQLSSQQVSCGKPSDCDWGQRYDARAGKCIACVAGDCGSSCGDCPVGSACVSGQCVIAGICEIDDIDKADSNVLGGKCNWGEGEIKDVDLITSLLPGVDCSFHDSKCNYDAKIEPLGGWEPSCPKGAHRSKDDPDLCVCKNADEVMYAGALECDSCDPVASGGMYCDCGENAVFSDNLLLDQTFQLLSYRAECGKPNMKCPDGQWFDGSSCAACEPQQCGQGCLCQAGWTCVSGVCVGGIAGRVSSITTIAARYDEIVQGALRNTSGGTVEDTSVCVELGTFESWPAGSSATQVQGTDGCVYDAVPLPCTFGEGDLIPLGAIGEFVPGETYTWAFPDGCSYEVKAEALSR